LTNEIDLLARLLRRQHRAGQRSQRSALRRRDRQLRHVVEHRLGAQAVHRQPPLQIGEPRCLAVEPDRLARPDHDEIVQVFALRGQQGGIERAIGRDLVRLGR